MKTVAKRIYIALIILFLYAPIGILMVLSFNESKTRAKWGGFTFQWYIELFQNEEILRALFNTLLIAFASSLIATVIGTVACIAMTGMKRRAMESAQVASRTGSPTRPSGANKRRSASESSVVVESSMRALLAYTSSITRAATTTPAAQPKAAAL